MSLRQHLEHDLRSWRMVKRMRKKFRREIETELWIERVRRGRERSPAWRDRNARLERWLVAVGLLVMAIVLMRACA